MGAVVATVILIVTLLALFFNPDYNRGVGEQRSRFWRGLAWVALHARKRLILTPEERFAIEHGDTRHKP